MLPPENAEIIEFPTSTMWFDENGILCSIAKNAPAGSIEEAEKQMEEFRKITGGKKVCILSDSTNSNPNMTREMRDYAAEVLPPFIKAIGIISRSPVGKMAANLFFAIKSQPYPIKFFNEETEAKEWLKQYL